MDRKSSSSFIISGSGPWTNEKHLHYLNSLEASFVRTMFENNNRRLDRYLPDSSTLDHHHHATKIHAATSAARDIIGPKTGMDSKADKRFIRRHSYEPYTSSQDQVVPQMGNRRGYKDERDSSHAPTK